MSDATRQHAAASRPEIQQLAHTLALDPSQLTMLTEVSASDVRVLRAQIAAALFDADKARFAKVAALAKAIPVVVAAKLSELVFPPLLAARTAEVIEPKRAVELVGRLSDGYLADVSAVMDPVRASAVVVQLPADRVGTIAAELARREEWVAIGGFVDQVSRAALVASVRAFDGEQLLRIGFLLEDKDRLDEVFGLLTGEQVDELLLAAVAHALWDELDEFVRHLRGPRSEVLAAHFAGCPQDVGAAVREAAAAGALSAATLVALQVH
jgi:hypothetical protein